MAEATQAPRADEGKYSRRRVAVLVLVHIVAGLHIAHWKLTGRTVAPLELNEVVYTFAVGIVTAGFLLLAAAFVASAIFGRYFCSWACHILALQDTCHWLLGLFGIKPRPLRSRALRFVPIVAALYMFAAPLVVRMVQERRLPTFHLRSDSQGWASLVTSDFWRNLPGGWVILTTFFVCGFVIVYALGSRAFCTSVCPYGALFGLADRIAPGRLVSKGDCSSCGRCTAVCTSHVRVQHELEQFGTIVDKNCLRDLDCMAACPKGNIRFGFTKPPILRGGGAWSGLTRKFDLSGAEEVLVVALCAAVFFAMRGLYDTVPFLLAIALAVVAAGLGVVLVRVLRRRDTRFQKLVLVREGRVRAGGVTFTAFGALGAAFVLHSGWIRWHEFAAERALAEIERGGASASDPRVGAASEHVALVRRFGLLDSRAAKLRQARVAELEGRLADAERVLVELSGGEPKDRLVVLPLARVWAMQDKTAEAESWLEAALALVPEVQHDRRDALDFLGEVHLRRGELAVRAGDFALARERLVKALEFTPNWSLVHYQLGVVHGSLGEGVEAKACFARAVELAPGDVDARNNLGFLLLDEGLTVDAERQLRTAVGLAPTHAAAQFNLGRALLALGREREGREHLSRSRELDPRFDEAVAQVLAAPR